MTRSQAARIANASCKTASIDLARGRIPLVEINHHERLSAELKIEKTAAQKTEKAASANESSLDGRVSREKLVAEDIESGPQLDSASHSHQEVADQPFSHSHNVPEAAAIEEQQEGKSKENSSEKNAEDIAQNWLSTSGIQTQVQRGSKALTKDTEVTGAGMTFHIC
ncbi:UNVERIFIED_CONTAM: hypothetical protein K2H54_049996 [Gekko kuhli]